MEVTNAWLQTGNLWKEEKLLISRDELFEVNIVKSKVEVMLKQNFLIFMICDY